MNNYAKSLFSFCAGVAIGAGVTYIFVKDKFERKTEEEVEFVRKSFLNNAQEKAKQNSFMKEEIGKDILTFEKVDESLIPKSTIDSVPESTILNDIFTQEIVDQIEEIEQSGLHLTEIGATDHPDDEDEPVIIDPDLFGEDDDYDKVTLYYYSDKVLAYEDESIVKNVDDLIGNDNLAELDDYGDSLYIKNPSTKTYYEVLKILSDYSDLGHDEV